MKANDMDIEHPDITCAERTGYPCPAPYKVEVEVTESVQRSYINDNKEDFIDWCFADPEIIRRYLAETESGLCGWVREVLAG